MQRYPYPHTAAPAPMHYRPSSYPDAGATPHSYPEPGAVQYENRQDPKAGLVWGDLTPPLDEGRESDGDDSYESYGMIGELTRRINAITVSSRSHLPAKAVAVEKTPRLPNKPVVVEKTGAVEKTKKRLGRPRRDARGRGLWRYEQQEQQDRARERKSRGASGYEPQQNRLGHPRYERGRGLHPYQQKELYRKLDRARERKSQGANGYGPQHTHTQGSALGKKAKKEISTATAK
ncbi:hypothetical protein B0H19DRAFT_1271746 [Mycena capillaripes]|nr:hypothetical protein B0H19DRAFT_1271746 [Mycena capillaripes]